MNSIRTWYLKNQTEITWFIIGWLALAVLNALAKGDYINAAISFALIGLNISLNKR